MKTASAEISQRTGFYNTPQDLTLELMLCLYLLDHPSITVPQPFTVWPMENRTSCMRYLVGRIVFSPERCQLENEARTKGKGRVR